MAEKRNGDRSRAACAAYVRSGALRVPCTITDVSPSGARIRLESIAFLANDCVVDASLFKDAMPARIVWRRGAEIGVRFKGTAVRRSPEPGRPRSFAPTQVGSWGGWRR